MPCYISRLVQLCKDVLGKYFTKFNSHLIYHRERERMAIMMRLWVKGKEVEKKKLPNELIPQITPCTKILCSYNAINAPIITNESSQNQISEIMRKRKKAITIRPKKKKKLTQSRRSQKGEHDTRTRPITSKYFTLHQNF